MIFSSLHFIFYFLPVALAGYFLLGYASRSAQNVWLLVMSLIFYAWGEPLGVLYVTLSIVFNYFVAIKIESLHDAKRGRSARHLLLGAVFLNFAALIYYKPLWAIADVVNYFGGGPVIPLPHLALPVGLSFFTLRAVSYLVDV